MTFARAAALVVLLLLAACSKPDVVFDGAAFEATGWKGPAPAEGWPSVFAVYAGQGADMPPMLGDYERQGSRIVFSPRFRPSPGLRMRAVFRPPGGSPIERTFIQAAAAQVRDAAKVIAIHPASDVLPENQLKLYVEFSKPMTRGVAWEHVRLFDEDGREVARPFVEIDEELWDPEGRRLTVLFDPGRIKRGLGENMESGAPLTVGKTFTLSVKDGWRDADGAPLAATVSKRFKVGPAERRPVTPALWRIETPKPGGRDPLVVHFDRPLDHALLQHVLSVRRAGEALAGSATSADQDRRWVFVPDRPWRAGDHALQADMSLEDLAGNRIGRSFDVDTALDDQPKIYKAFETLPFRIGS